MLRNYPMNGSAAGAHAHKDQQEVDIGTYQVLQGERIVAELLVEEDPAHPGDSTHRIEHWGLYPGYTMPSLSDPSTTLVFKYNAVEYGGSSSDFRTHLRTISGIRYICASCVEQRP